MSFKAGTTLLIDSLASIGGFGRENTVIREYDNVVAVKNHSQDGVIALRLDRDMVSSGIENGDIVVSES